MKVILYVIDSFRADHLSCYGYERRTTSNIDRLAQQGILFKNAFSQSTWTMPSAASILSGVYPLVHGARRMMIDDFSVELLRLPEILRNRGYKTAGFSAQGHVSSSLGFARGFDIYCDLYKDDRIYNKRQTKNLCAAKERRKIICPLAEDINKYVFEFLENNYKSDFFVFIWSIDPHYPYTFHEGINMFINPNYDGIIDGSVETIHKARTMNDLAHIIDLYDNEIYYNDFSIGNLINELKELNIYDETMFVITSDHGDSLGEIRDGIYIDKMPFNIPFRKGSPHIGHPYYPYDELIHIPLIIKLPGNEHKGIKIEQLVQSIDIMPTILSYLDIDYDEMQGKSLLPVINGEAESINNYTYSETIYGNEGKEVSSFSIRNQCWKFILRKDGEYSSRDWIKMPKRFLKDWLFSHKRMLFCTKVDRAERINCIKENPILADKMERVLLKWIENNRKKSLRSSKKMEMDEETRQQLKALGYID